MSGTSDGVELKPPLSKKPRQDNGGGESSVVKDDSSLLPQEGVEGQGSHPQESDVGITQYVSDHEGFFAILKRRLAAPPSSLHCHAPLRLALPRPSLLYAPRYSDFVVHEVAESGDIVRLTNHSIPFEGNEVSVCVYMCEYVCVCTCEYVCVCMCEYVCVCMYLHK